jgi:predicted ester cyclase
MQTDTGDLDMASTVIPQASAEANIERNKATVRRMLECLSAGDVAGFTEHLVPDYRRHCQAMPPGMDEIHGREMMHEWLVSNLVTFPDFREAIESLVGDGEFVAWRSRGTGTQAGPLGPFPPTNKRMDLVIMGMHRFENGLVAETWTSWDNVAVLTQLGHMTPVT